MVTAKHQICIQRIVSSTSGHVLLGNNCI